MEPKVEEHPLDSVPEAGTSNILKTLWFPTSTTPPRNLARLSMDVPSCSVSSGISLWSHSKTDRIGWNSVSLSAEEESWKYDSHS